MSESIRLTGIEKTFDAPDGTPVRAVKGVSLEIEAGELVTLLGPSGCGKTTLLRMIAGFEEPTAGEIFFGARRMNAVPPNRRDAAMVFQSYAVFPHLDVSENVAFGLKLRHLPRAEVAERVGRVLEQTGLARFARHSPSQLSGGQQQRVALARCLVMEPKVLLFDEPLSNLDAKLREQMRVEIRELQQRFAITAIYVTHDQIEAMSISDRIVVMNVGEVEQSGTPHAIYAHPASRFVADFVGKANFVETTVAAGGTVGIAGTRLALPGLEGRPPGPVTLVLRPEGIRLDPEGPIEGRIRRAMFLGSVVEYQVELPGGTLWLVDHPNPAETGLHRPGEPLRLSLSPASIHALP